ncbi:MAG: DNRLRE domain-containing protein [Phycisphaerales bacterium]
MRTTTLCATAIAAMATFSGGAFAGSVLPPTIVNLTSVLDNTLYEESGGGLSNALGPNIFAGQTRFAGPRRAVIEFDVSSIPSNATIVSATMTLNLTRAISDGNIQTAHRVLAGWGEGTSSSGPDEFANPGGSGELSTTGDATWVHRFFSGTNWTTPGGDFAPTASASAVVDSFTGPYNWTGPGMAADVQGWIADASTNHGWLILGTEGAGQNAKRYASRENTNPALRPVLTVTYTVPPPPCVGDLNNDGQRNTIDLTLFLSAFGSVVPPGTGADFDASGTVTTADLVIFLSVFGVPC